MWRIENPADLAGSSGRKPGDVKTVARKRGSGRLPAAEGDGEAFGAILRTVSAGIARAARSGGGTGGPLPEAVVSVVQSALRESLSVGGSLVVAVKAIVMGVLRGSGEKDAAALQTLSIVARGILRETAALYGDVGAAATGLVLGAIAGARGISVAPSRAASAARDAIVAEAERIGSVVVERVRATLRKELGGFKALTPEPLRI